jgi:predicted restriction endonuclease
MKKKLIREAFRNAVFIRDGYKCKICGHNVLADLDAHHIIDRHDAPNGGYVPENGITLCNINCHQIAEQFHNTGTTLPGFMPDDLFRLIGSSRERAMQASRDFKIL